MVAVAAPETPLDRDDLGVLIERVTAKTLILNGQHDEPAAYAAATWYKDHLASARVEMVPGDGELAPARRVGAGAGARGTAHEALSPAREIGATRAVSASRASGRGRYPRRDARTLLFRRGPGRRALGCRDACPIRSACPAATSAGRADLWRRRPAHAASRSSSGMPERMACVSKITSSEVRAYGAAAIRS